MFSYFPLAIASLSSPIYRKFSQKKLCIFTLLPFSLKFNPTGSKLDQPPDSQKLLLGRSLVILELLNLVSIISSYLTWFLCKVTIHLSLPRTSPVYTYSFGLVINSAPFCSQKDPTLHEEVGHPTIDSIWYIGLLSCSYDTFFIWLLDTVFLLFSLPRWL